MIVAGVWTSVGFSNLKNSRNRTRIPKFWKRSVVWKSDSGHLCYELGHAVEFAYNDSSCNDSSPITRLFRRSPQNILFVHNGSCKFSSQFEVKARLCGTKHTNLLWPNSNRWAVTGVTEELHQELRHQQQWREFVT